jgi:hypothetical protein
MSSIARLSAFPSPRLSAEERPLAKGALTCCSGTPIRKSAWAVVTEMTRRYANMSAEELQAVHERVTHSLIGALSIVQPLELAICENTVLEERRLYEGSDPISRSTPALRRIRRCLSRFSKGKRQRAEAWRTLHSLSVSLYQGFFAKADY